MGRATVLALAPALLLALTLAAGGRGSAVEPEAVRFCPGEEPPVAFNAVTGTYEAGASFDPLLCAEEPCIELLHNIFEPLVAVTPGQALEPRLATAWHRIDDVTFRFSLRRGVRFHDGEPFDAEAVRFSLRRASDAYGVTAWFPKIARVEVREPLTVDVVLQRPDSLFLHRLGHIALILPPKYFQQVGPERFGRKPVGTGPFRFVGWDARRREVQLAANRHYWRPGYPRVQRLVYAYMPPDEALELLVAGQLDLIRRLNPRRTTQFMRLGTGSVVKAWLPQLVLGPFNLLKPGTPLRDRRVREAINLAINRDHLIRYGAFGNGRPLGGYTVPEDPHHAGLAPYPFDPARAQQLLADAGHGSGLTLSIMIDKQVPPQIENIIAVSLRQIGVAVQLQRASESEFLREVYLPKFAGPAVPAFDVLLLSMPAGAIFHAGMVPMTLLYSGKPNESAVRDPVLDALYEEALATYDPAAAAALWKKLERYVHEAHLLLTGYQEKAVFGAAPRLRFTPRTLMTFGDAYYE
jgi:peptide/nickel transport system substrate-binding protein